jgi:organic radical activating enzyme
MHLIITGGEPLVRADLFELLAHARRLGLALTLYTNGHLVDDAVADRLAELVGVVEISVLAGEPAVRDRLRALGVEWQPDLDITATYDGDAAPLRYRAGEAERAAFLAELPEFRARPRDPGVQNGTCLAGRQFAFVDALG